MEEKNVEFNHINVQVFQLLEDLEAAGNITTPRGFQCKGANLATLDIDPLYPIMDFVPRKFNFRYFLCNFLIFTTSSIIFNLWNFISINSLIFCSL